jgi:hypothetical protein
MERSWATRFVAASGVKIPLGIVSAGGIRWHYAVKPPMPHMHVMGQSGSGKSRFLAGLFLSLHDAGIATTLVDPHGDLAHLILQHLVSRGTYRGVKSGVNNPYRKILYFDLPAGERNGVYAPFNVLNQELPSHTIASNFKEAMHRAFAELSIGAPSFDTLLPRALRVLMYHGQKLTQLESFFTKPDYRGDLLASFPDPTIADFFNNVYDQLRTTEQQTYAGSVIRRAALLTDLPILRHSFGQDHNFFNFRKIMDGGHSLILNLRVREEEANQLLGSLVTVGMEQAAISRADTKLERTPHYLIIDEVTSYVTKSGKAFSHMLSQTRKYNLNLCMAHQTWSQMDEELQGALGNARIKVMFQQDRMDAEITARLLGVPNPLHVKHQPGGESNPAYYQLQEEWESWIQAIQNLPERYFYMRRSAQHWPLWYRALRGMAHPKPVVRKLRALPMPDPVVDPGEMAEVEAEYLRRYFRKPKDAVWENPVIEKTSPLKGRFREVQ